MTRSFDRRGGYPGGSKPVGELMPPPANIRSASIRPKKEEPVSLDSDCMCEKNDPDCAECWVPQPAGVRKFPITFPVRSDFDMDVRYRFDECLELLLRKQADYGPLNIANAPGGALNGLRVRLHDKLARINNLIDNNVAPSNESLRDSFVDSVNYNLIAIMVLDGVWK
jgi:hypothetical protein